MNHRQPLRNCHDAGFLKHLPRCGIRRLLPRIDDRGLAAALGAGLPDRGRPPASRFSTWTGREQLLARRCCQPE
ncbi:MULTISPECIES: hypothetical protein [Streptomyces]|uniref:hypothetical protein n=1 Tax=Streptomyces TaxID=1883 RepID=UPI0029BD17F6|nr:hypothetical protein [Streptomyces sp. NRRL_B-2557]MDX2748344.1 hypothetical protein [Streptomyces sp. NRRL_B-2557]